MAIAILGPGNMGKGLARLLLASGHDVVIGHPDPAKAEAIASELGGKATGHGVAAAASAGDIVFLSCPFGAISAALGAAGDLTGKVIVDITNPISADYMSLVIGHTTSAAEEVAKLAPGAHVVKAFNTIFWQILPREARSGKPPVQVLLAGDNKSAKDRTSTLVTEMGFEAVDAGPLTNARFIEPVGELNIHFGYALGWGTAIAPAWVRLAS